MPNFITAVTQKIKQNGIGSVLPSYIDLTNTMFGLVNNLGGRRNAIVLAVISIAVVIGVTIYWKLFRVPTHLQGLPRIPISVTLKKMTKKIPLIEEVRLHNQALCENAFHRGLVSSPNECPEMWTEWNQGKWQVMLANPIDIKDLYVNHAKFEKTEASLPRYTFDKVFGTVVGTVQTPQWKTQRKIINPAFRRGWATSLFSEPTVNLLTHFDKYADSKEPIDISQWMRRITLDAMSSIIMGFNLDSVNDPDSRLIKVYERLITRVFDPASNVFGGNVLSFSKRIKEFHQDLDEFNAFVYGWIDRATAEIMNQAHESSESDNNDNKNLLEMMVVAQLKDPDSFSKEDLRSNCAGFFVAGHDTTSTALTAAIYLLGMHPEVQEKARNEVIEVMGRSNASNSKNISLATNKEQCDMRYLTCVIKEAARLYSAPTTLPRVLMSEHTFSSSGLQVPQGTIVSAHSWNAQRKDEYWNNNPNEFMPERWEALSPDAESIPLHPSAHNFTWTPFGGGQRICIGQTFSIVEQRVILSALLQQYSWKVVGNKAALSGNPDNLPNSPLILKDVMVELTHLNK